MIEEANGMVESNKLDSTHEVLLTALVDKIDSARKRILKAATDTAA